MSDSERFTDRMEYLRENKWSRFRRALRRDDQEAFDNMWEAAERYAMAGGNLNPSDVEAAVLMSILLDQQQRIEELESRVDELDS